MSTATELIEAATEAAEYSFVPYSRSGAACVVLLSDGHIIPGVRVESASFTLLIPPLVNAFSTAAALNRTDIAAVASSEPFRREDIAYLSEVYTGAFTPVGERLAVRRASDGLPDIKGRLSPVVDTANSTGDEDLFALTREIASRAVVPESSFPVAGLLVFSDGSAIPGVNVEHSDWTRGICAERNTIGTMVSYGFSDPERLYLTCSLDTGCTPCGACRQLLNEFAPAASIIMDRGAGRSEVVTPKDLLPGFFSGGAIPMSSHRSNKN